MLNNNVQFKYSLGKPKNPTIVGAFYWINENNQNHLYFSPSQNVEDLLRLDNILSGQGGQSIQNNQSNTDRIVYIASIFANPTDEEKNNIKEGKWNDSDWESYIQTLTNAENANVTIGDKVEPNGGTYGNVSNIPYSVGCVVLCGSREFLCTHSFVEYTTFTEDGKEYYKDRKKEAACVDVDGYKILKTDSAPSNAEVSSIETTWEIFGVLDEETMANIVKHITLAIDTESESFLEVTENTNENGGVEYTLKLKTKTISIDSEDDDTSDGVATANNVKGYVTNYVENYVTNEINNALVWESIEGEEEPTD